MKTELEKVAEKLASTTDEFNMFIAGAKWQAERMYYEEEVVDLIADWTKMAKGLNMNFPADKFEQWFEQFKKKYLWQK